MTENKPCDPWIIEKEREERQAELLGIALSKLSPWSILENKPLDLIIYSEKSCMEPKNGGHDFGLPINKKENND